MTALWQAIVKLLQKESIQSIRVFNEPNVYHKPYSLQLQVKLNCNALEHSNVCRDGMDGALQKGRSEQRHSPANRAQEQKTASTKWSLPQLLGLCACDGVTQK